MLGWFLEKIYDRRQTKYDFSAMAAKEIYDKKLMGAAAYQASRGDPIAARKLAQIYAVSSAFFPACFWFNQAVAGGDSESLRDLAELHFVFASRPYEKRFLDTEVPNLDRALSLADRGVIHKVHGCLSLKAKILQKIARPGNTTDDTLFLEACSLAAQNEEDDWARMVMILACKASKEVALQGKTKEDAIAYWLQRGEPAPLSSVCMAKLILGGSITGDPLPYMKFAAEKGNSDGLYLFGKHLILVEKEISKGESLLRKAIRQNHIEASAFLADFKASQTNDPASQLEADTLYKEASDKGHLGARTIMAIRGLMDQSRGIPRDKCLQIIRECCKRNVPSALLFAKRHALKV